MQLDVVFGEKGVKFTQQVFKEKVNIKWVWFTKIHQNFSPLKSFLQLFYNVKLLYLGAKGNSVNKFNKIRYFYTVYLLNLFSTSP